MYSETVTSLVKQLRKSLPNYKIESQDFDSEEYIEVYLEGSHFKLTVKHEEQMPKSIEVSIELFFVAYADSYSSAEDLDDSIEYHKYCISTIQYLYNKLGKKPNIYCYVMLDVMDTGYYTVSISTDINIDKLMFIIEKVEEAKIYYMSNSDDKFKEGLINFNDDLQIYKETETIFSNMCSGK